MTPANSNQLASYDTVLSLAGSSNNAEYDVPSTGTNNFHAVDSQCLAVPCMRCIYGVRELMGESTAFVCFILFFVTVQLILSNSLNIGKIQR